MRPSRQPVCRALVLLAILSARAPYSCAPVRAGRNRARVPWPPPREKTSAHGTRKSPACARRPASLRGEEADLILDGRRTNASTSTTRGSGCLRANSSGRQRRTDCFRLRLPVHRHPPRRRAGAEPAGRGRHRRGPHRRGRRSGPRPGARRPAERRGRVCPRLPPARPLADDLAVFFVDAGTGELVLRYSDLQTTIGTGQGVHKRHEEDEYDGAQWHLHGDRRHASPGHLHLRPQGQLARTQAYLNGLLTLNDTDVAADADNQWSDTAAVDAHAYAGWTYDYLYKRFNRQGWTTAISRDEHRASRPARGLGGARRPRC